jgi:hypothetical protein
VLRISRLQKRLEVGQFKPMCHSSRHELHSAEATILAAVENGASALKLQLLATR